MYVPTRLGEDCRDSRPHAHHELPRRGITKSASVQLTAEQSRHKWIDDRETYNLVAGEAA